MRVSFISSGTRDGFVHRLDVRTKMGVSLLGSIAVAVLNRPEPLGFLLGAALVYAWTVKRPKVLAIGHLALVAMWVVALGFLLGMHFLMPSMGEVKLHTLLTPFLRTAIMLNVILAMALSTRIQTVLSTLKSLRLPQCVVIPAAVMIRFIPSFIADIRQITETLKTRGYRLSPLVVLRQPRLYTRLLFVPLVFRALRAADELGIAAELKGLGYARKVRPCRPLSFTGRDWFASGAALTCAAVGLFWQARLGWSGGGMF